MDANDSQDLLRAHPGVDRPYNLLKFRFRPAAP